MNNIFDIKRFGRYLAYDIRQTIANSGISLLVVGTLPVLIYLLSGLASLIFNGHWEADPETTQVFAIIAAVMVIMMAFPTKAYGSLTDRKGGATWALIPASVPEKFVSMMLVSLVIVPCAVILMLLASNALMSLCVSDFTNLMPQLLRYHGSADGMPLEVNFFALFYASWIVSILVFLLGALIFKKSKAGKTILCLIALSVLFSLVASSIVRSGWEPDLHILDWLENATAEQIQARFNTWANLWHTFLILLLGGGVYARLKTLKY